ncbi:hypothetical protein Forpe1208_v012212 [Fusarium oxysporum f. sp. rapae]|uniref:Uncharacterized protein n=1 Tax=Fusarium oxysporum f. sp. rapae TaxID=485398 RepID=A0A8J5NSF2_FUSOX|nr:hypothetical protein Forpe1208_v012212 [Fusarium oxysporum f. sp. rapae]
MGARKKKIRMSTGGKAPLNPIVRSRNCFNRIIQRLEPDALQNLIAIINDPSERESAQKALDKLRNSTKEKHDGDLHLLSYEDMSSVVRSVERGKEKQQSSTPVRMPKRHSTANTSMQAVRNTHRYKTRSQVKRKNHSLGPTVEKPTIRKLI